MPLIVKSAPCLLLTALLLPAAMVPIAHASDLDVTIRVIDRHDSDVDAFINRIEPPGREGRPPDLRRSAPGAGESRSEQPRGRGAEAIESAREAARERRQEAVEESRHQRREAREHRPGPPR